MTWKERRIVTLLTTILLILMAAVLIVLGIRYREHRAAAEDVSAEIELSDDTISPDTYMTLSYDNGSTVLSFFRNADYAWQWDGDTAFPLDDTVIQEILTLLQDFAPQQILTDAEALENSGLDKPTASLTASTEGGNTTTLLFGKTTTDADSYYVRLNEDESTVYIIADTLYQKMCIPIYDMCILPKLPEITESKIRSISIQGPAQEELPGIRTLLTAQQAEGADTVSWRAGGANVSDDPTVRALLEDLTNLTLTKCVIYNPSEEAASFCGFDAPAAQLTILYSSAGGTDLDLKLTVGNTLPDSSGRYARLGEDPSLYLLPADLADPLVALAKTGLE